MKTWLVTGAAGFIGSHLVDRLSADPELHIIAVDNFDPFYPRSIKQTNMSGWAGSAQVTMLELDLALPGSYEVLKQYPIQGIVHLAAKAGVRPSIADPLAYQRANVEATQYLLEFARAQSIRSFVFASSSSVYGINPRVPWQEEERLLPISPYASTKLSCEMLGHVYSHLFGIRFIALRFFTVYGPRQRPDLAIHKFFHQILHGLPIPVYGDGSSSRDYTFIGDIVEGILSAMQYRDSAFEIINLGNHQVVTLNELIAAIESVAGRTAVRESLPMQAGDVPSTYADIGKAAALLSYSPRTTLKEGLSAFYQWYQARESGL